MHHQMKLFPFLSLFFFFSIAENINPNFTACEPQPCRGGNNLIKFPFMIQSQGPNCGLPGFKLLCDDHGKTIFSLGLGNYSVNHIFYNNQTLRISPVYPNISCPVPLHDFTLPNPNLFSLTQSDLNLTLLNCSGTIPEEFKPDELSCLSGETHYSIAVLTSNIGIFNNCEPRGSPVPVLRDMTLDYGHNIGRMMVSGFELQWTARNCSKCEDSGGRCGFDTGKTNFICFCPHGSSYNFCKDSKKNVGLKIIIGISASAGTLLLTGAAFFVYYRRRKMKQTSPSSLFLTRSMSSDPPIKPDHEKGSTTQFLTNMPTLSLFTYKELEQATNSFNPSNELGDGGFGTVYYGKLRDGRSVAVKRLYENNYKRVEQFMNEVKILSGLRHQNLVCLYGCTSRHSRELLLVYEYIPNGTVADHLHGDLAKVKGGLNWSTRLKIALETAEALAFLHAVEPPIIHRDVKTNNILLDNSYQVKVADFGLSRLFPLDATHVSTAPQGTPGYVDPDYHQCYQLTDKSDVYSFGVVLVELISSKPAVDITRHRHEINLANLAINKIINRALSELVDQSLGFESDFRVRRMMTGVAELAFRCLSAEKEERPTMEEVLEILRGIEKDGIEGKTPKEQPEILADDVVLLKSQVPFSPDSVTEKWASRSTTPNTSNEG